MALWLATGIARAALDPADWRFTETLDVTTPGLVKAVLPLPTLGALRPQAADLRLLDPAGGEVAWFLERPLQFIPEAPVRAVKSFQVTLQTQATVLLLETGVNQPVSALTLDAGQGSFLKAARLEGSTDGRTWQLIAGGLPIYQRYQGETRLQLTFPPGNWPWLRVTLDDARTLPVPFVGARVQVLGTGVSMVMETAAARLGAREELPGQTRLPLDLGAANLDVAFLTVASLEGYFTRKASLRVRTVERGTWVEQTVVRGFLHREPTERGDSPGSAARLEVNRAVPAREAVLVIENGDSPPLPVTGVTVTWPPVQLVFWAREMGRFKLLAGNSECPPPQYDLASFAEQFRTARPQAATFGVLTNNPAYRPPTVAPDPFALGAPLEVTAWRFRKPLPIDAPGAQQLELDLDVLARAQPDLADLRLVSEGRQRPFIVEPGAGSRTLAMTPIAADDPKKPAVSRWQLKLPFPGLPFATATIASSTPLFERGVNLYEERTDDRGGNYRRPLGEARWRRTPGEAIRPLTLELRERPVTDALWLEIEHGDNAPLALEEVSLNYPATRLHFLAPTTPVTALHYGNPAAAAPSYDLQLIAPRLLGAESARLIAGLEEAVGGRSIFRDWTLAGRGSWLFWAALVVVVAALLLILRRLLPAPKI